MSDELKPCPFCGKRPERFVCAKTLGHDYAVIYECNDAHHRVWCEADNDADAINVWNTRAAVTEEKFTMAVHDGEAWQKVRECRIDGVSGGGNCGTTTYRLSCGHVAVVPDGIRFEHCPSCGAKVVG